MRSIRRHVGRAVATVWRLTVRGRWLLAGVTLSAIVGLVAFGLLSPDGSSDSAVAVGGEPISGANEEFDGCLALQEWEAERILHGPVWQVAKPTDSPATATCAWESGTGSTTRSIQFSVFRGTQLYDPKPFQDDETFEKLDGVGDEAFFVATGGGRVHLRAGEFAALFSVQGLDGAEAEKTKGRLTTLASRFGEWVHAGGRPEAVSK